MLRKGHFSLKISIHEYQLLDGIKTSLVNKIGDSSIIKRFDRTWKTDKTRPVVRQDRQCGTEAVLRPLARVGRSDWTGNAQVDGFRPARLLSAETRQDNQQRVPAHHARRSARSGQNDRRQNTRQNIRLSGRH